MKRLKIIHVLHSVGGVDVSLRLILENIDANRFDNLVVHGLEDTRRVFSDKNGNLKSYRLPIKRNISILADVKSVVSLVSILRKEKPDLIHAHSAKGGIIARAASIFYRTNVLHTPQAYSYLSVSKGFKRTIYLFIEKLFKNINSILLASSPSELNRGINEVGYKPSSTELFNNSIVPISLKNRELNPEVEWPEIYICSVGRPSFQKNIEMMVEVIKAVKAIIPSIHLVLMGVGEYSPNVDSVEAMIEKYNLKKNITLVSWIEREEIFKIISNSMLYISTARYEGLPYSIIESLALSKACVVTDADGNRDLIVDGENGYVVKNNSVEEMAERICSLARNQELRNEMERKSHELFHLNYNMNVNISRLEGIYLKYV